MSADANAAQPDEIFVMRMHFECGWLEQFATGDQETVTEAAENHIVLGSELAADLGLGREELAGEVAASSRRVLAEKDNIDHLERRLIECRRNTYEN